jgi:hypothetical protein
MPRPRNKIQSKRVSLTGFVSPVLYGDMLEWLEALPSGKRFIVVVNILSLVADMLKGNIGKDVDEINKFINNKKKFNIVKLKRRAIGLTLRFEIFERDKYRCVYCGRNADDGVKLEVDHIHPFSKGGSSDKSNLQVLCFDCNHGKRDKEISEEVQFNL